MIAGVPVYWLLYAALGIELITSLLYIRRAHEWDHHGYYALIAGLSPWWWLRILALLVLADDVYQHSVQAHDAYEGRKPRADFSPLHRFYVWVYTRMEAHFTNNED